MLAVCWWYGWSSKKENQPQSTGKHLGKNKTSCRRVLRLQTSQIRSLFWFSGKIMPTICHWTQENIFASTVLCNHEPTYAFCISLESTCHFLGSCLAITVRKELNSTAVPNTMEVHSAVLHDWNVRMFKHFQPHENTFGHVWNKASREQPREMFP